MKILNKICKNCKFENSSKNFFSKIDILKKLAILNDLKNFEKLEILDNFKMVEKLAILTILKKLTISDNFKI